MTLLTSDLGLVRAVAKGAKRVANGFRGPLDTGMIYEVRLRRRGGEGLHHLNSAFVREPLPALRRDPARFTAAALVLEVAADLMREDEPFEELFRLTVFTLKALDRAPRARIGLVATLFLARVVTLSGHLPEIERCVACGRPLDADERPLLAPLRGGLLHLACGQGEPAARTVSHAALALLSRLWRTPAAQVLGGDVDPGPLQELRRALTAWLQHVLERGFRAATPMEREISLVQALD